MRKLCAVRIAIRVTDRLFKSRKSGANVAVSGTAPIAPDGAVACPRDVYGQTRRCLDIIAQAVTESGLSLETIVRTRIMLTDISQWEAAARAHGDFFAAVRPATTFVEVRASSIPNGSLRLRPIVLRSPS
jgi:enamine deaminase RidA (YjgF/YER057c/UK114 family)